MLKTSLLYFHLEVIGKRYLRSVVFMTWDNNVGVPGTIERLATTAFPFLKLAIVSPLADSNHNGFYMIQQFYNNIIY